MSFGCSVLVLSGECSQYERLLFVTMDIGTSQIRPVEEILEQGTRLATGQTIGTQTLIFSLLSQDDVPEAVKMSLAGMLWISSFACGLGLTIHFWQKLESIYIKAGSISALATLFLLTGLTAVRRRRELRRFAESLGNVVLELDEIRDSLSKYQQELHERTARYFHCVTHNKVISLFVLNQLANALSKRIEMVRDLLDKPTRKNVRTAHELLHKDLSFRDGATPDSGDERRISLIFVEKVVSDLIHNLNLSLAILEKELEEETISTTSQSATPLKDDSDEES